MVFSTPVSGMPAREAAGQDKNGKGLVIIFHAALLLMTLHISMQSQTSRQTEIGIGIMA